MFPVEKDTKTCVAPLLFKSNKHIILSSVEGRYPELDIFRGIAVLAMIVYHGVFDLEYFYGWSIGLRTAPWELMRVATVSTFLALVGICFTISWHKTPVHARLRKYAQRSITIFAGGMLISLMTWFFASDAFVKFGILHLIGVSVFLQMLFARIGAWNIATGILVMLLALFLPATTSSSLLFPLGIPSPSFASLDYYPLIPWFGLILLGMGIGSLLYIPEPRWQWTCRIPLLEYTGKRALLIYFIHQPILLGILFLLH